MAGEWISANWPQLVTAGMVIVHIVRSQQQGQINTVAISGLGAKLDRVADETQKKITEIEKMLVSIGPRQRDLDRMEREVEALWKRVDQMRVDVAAMKARDGAHGHQDLERESGPMPPRERDSNE